MFVLSGRCHIWMEKEESLIKVLNSSTLALGWEYISVQDL